MTTQKKSGFQRLRGLAAAGVAATAGLFGAAGSARAASVPEAVVTLNSIPAAGFDAIWTIGWANSTQTSTSAFVSELTFTNGTTGYYDGLDGVMYLAVDGTWYNNPAGTFDMTGLVATYPTQVDIVPGINASVQYRLFADRAVVRGIFTLTNTSNAPITVTATLDGNLGSDGSTTLQATSSGDAVLTDSDLWTVTNDRAFGVDPSFGNDPVITVSRGIGAVNTSALGGGNDSYDDDYTITIPAGATVRLLQFVEGSFTIADAVAGAESFESLAAAQSAGLLDDLSARELASIVNYNSAGFGGFGYGMGGDGGGALPATLLAGLGGLLALRLRRRKA